MADVWIETRQKWRMEIERLEAALRVTEDPADKAAFAALQPSASADHIGTTDEMVTATPTVEQAIEALKIALRDSKGWMIDYSDSVIRDAIDRVPARESELVARFLTLGANPNPDAWAKVAVDAARFLNQPETSKPVIYIDETGALQSSLGSKETEAVLGPLVDHMRLHIGGGATGAEPVAYRYKDVRGHWRYVGASFSKGWALPTNLSFEPLYATPTTVQAEEPCVPKFGARHTRCSLGTPGCVVIHEAEEPVDADQAFEDLYKVSSGDPSNREDLGFWRAGWVAGQRALSAPLAEAAYDAAIKYAGGHEVDWKEVIESAMKGAA